MDRRLALSWLVVALLGGTPSACRWARADPSLIVPPVQEIEILDPRVDPEGKPRSILETLPDGRQVVTIPPTVIVHRFYYTGDRTFRGPLLPGGPCVVVVSHPVTNERLYIDVQMLPGAPVVTYTRSCIAYKFEKRSIVIHFSGLSRVGLMCDPKVTYHNTPALTSAAAHAAEHVAHATGRWMYRTGLPSAGWHVVENTGEALKHTADIIHGAGTIVAAPVVNVLQVMPLGPAIIGSAEKRAAKLRDMKVQHAEPERIDTLEGTIRTLR